jgi:hypothetical protein
MSFTIAPALLCPNCAMQYTRCAGDVKPGRAASRRRPLPFAPFSPDPAYFCARAKKIFHPTNVLLFPQRRFTVCAKTRRRMAEVNPLAGGDVLKIGGFAVPLTQRFAFGQGRCREVLS